MDVIDEKLISALRENGRASTAMLAIPYLTIQ